MLLQRRNGGLYLKIQMIGINNADISIREKFSLSKERLGAVLREYKSLDGVEGIVIISTCNRTEVYVSANRSSNYNIAETFCTVLGQDYSEHKKYFFEKEEEIALNHLCFVGAGAYSQILGDDQIITQVREALEYSRTYGFTNSFLETFFRTAIGAAKEIKTKVVMRDIKASSAPHKAILMLKQLCDLSQQNILVIGNGQMGRLMSELLLKENANVTTTLRQYKKGMVQVPNGVSTTQYSKRYESMENSSIVVSATTSPHHTIYYDDCVNLRSIPKIMFDLAVPRDIDPRITHLNVKLFTIDDLGDRDNGLSAEKRQLAEEIINKHLEKYYRWVNYKREVVNNETLCSRNRTG